MLIIDFFLELIFILATSILLFLIFEKLLDRSPTDFREKLRLLIKNPKNLDTETRKLFFHYRGYFLGSVFLTISMQGFINLYLRRISVDIWQLAFAIFLLLWGVSEIVNEYFYEESKINYSYYEKYGWKYILRVNYYKELIKNSPIALIRDGAFILFGIGFLIFIALIIVLVLLVFVLNRF